MSDNEEGWKIVGKGGKPRVNNSRKTGVNSNQNDNEEYCNDNTGYVNQDWNSVKFNNKKSKQTQLVDKYNKNNSSQNSTTHLDSRRVRKIEELHETGDFSLEKSTKKLQNSIISGRTLLNLTQEDFAKLCNIQVNVLRSYERGMLMPTNEHMNIMSKKLGITLSK